MIEAGPPIEMLAEKSAALRALGQSSPRPASGGGSRAVGLKIGIEGTCWHNDRGFGRYVRSLIAALIRLDIENDYTLFLDAPPTWMPPGLRAELRVIASKVPASLAASADGHRSPADMWRLSRALAGGKFDLLIFPTIYSFVPVFSRARKIVFIYDVIADTFPHLTIPNPRARLFWTAKTKLGLFQADAVATLSEYSRRGVMEFHGVRPEQIHVVGCASDSIFRRLERPDLTPRQEALGLARPGRMLIYVGGFGPHKNLEQLLSVFATLAAFPEFDDVRLVLVGEYEQEVFYSRAGALRSQVQALDMAGRVVFTGFLPDDELVVLLNRATALVLPSLMEGFGLPALEAAACGCPVVATTASPLPDVLGEGGLYADPRSPEQLERALREVLSSEQLRARMSAAGQDAARRLTWDAAARQMQSVIRKVVQR
jgi:glycosyltransferase involved in cell wall biosynthesis